MIDDDDILDAMRYGYLFKNQSTNFQNQYLGSWNINIISPNGNVDILEIKEMPKAILSYEALQLDSEGIPTEGAYKLKLEGNFKRDIEPFVKWLKGTIPAGSDRIYDPNTYEWTYIEKWHPIIEMALKGANYRVEYHIRKEDFVELKRKQAEFAKQAGQTFQTRQYDIGQDLQTFRDLLVKANVIEDCTIDSQMSAMKIIEDWVRQEAEKAWKKALRFFHPDLHPERAAQASELNEVWSRLKEGYYIK